MEAHAELMVQPGSRLHWRSQPPLVLRPTGLVSGCPRQGEDNHSRVHLVQAAGGPLGGDDLRLHLELAAGARLQLRSAAATVVQPGPVVPPGTPVRAPAGAPPAAWTFTADLAAGAALDWRPEPTVVCDGAELVSRIRLRLAAGAGVVARELVVLGRHGQRGGRYRGELTVEVAGWPLLAHTTVLDGADEALRGPGGTGGHRVLGMLLAAGSATTPPPGAGARSGLRWACTPLAGPGRLLVAVGDSPEGVLAVLG